MLTKTVTLHATTGLIRWHYYANSQGLDASKVVGSYPWDWIHADDRQGAKIAFALAAIGQSSGSHRYRLDPEIFGGNWHVETLWQPTDHPGVVIGISSTWNELVEQLTPREREVAKLLPECSTKQIAKRLELSAKTVEVMRSRISHKIGDVNLIAWCTAHRDIL